MKRIGVFICWCGRNIGGIVDVPRVVEMIRDYPGVAIAVDYKYMCSDPGQGLIKEYVEKEGLDAVVVAACSPNMHEATFRGASAEAGLNPYQCEMANIREQCSWVHEQEPELATLKAAELTRTVIEKVRGDRDLEPIRFDVVRRALVVGGGVSGLEAALGIAASGYPVVIVDEAGALGGQVGRLSRSYLADDPARQMTQDLVDAVESHELITVQTSSRVTDVSGYVGNFQVTIATPTGQVAEDVGAVVLATGYSTLELDRLGEYGGGRIPDVVDSLAFERMLATGEIVRPSDGRPAREVVFIQCAGSRDTERGVPYCSRVCCMYTAKQSRELLRTVPGSEAHVFYIDIRAAGKDQEEYVQAAQEEGVTYLRGRPSRVYEEGGKVVVQGVDTLSERHVIIDADLVVLATAMVPAPRSRDVARLFKVGTDAHGFFSEAHPKLQPVESLTQGVFLAGCAGAPRDIPDSVSQAGATVSKIVGLFSRERLEHPPTVVEVDPDLCSACGLCVEACPYDARSINNVTGVADVNPILCQGCGGCQVACPNGATQHRNLTRRQVMSMLDALWGGGEL